MVFAQSKTLNLAPLLGKDFSAYEKVLGAPKLIEKGDLSDESKDPSVPTVNIFAGYEEVY